MLHVIRHIPLCSKHLAILYWVTKGPVNVIKEKTHDILHANSHHIATQYIVTCQFMWTPPNSQSSLLPKIPFSKCKEMTKIPTQPSPNYSTPPRRVPFLRSIIIAHQSEKFNAFQFQNIGFYSKLCSSNHVFNSKELIISLKLILNQNNLANFILNFIIILF